MASMEYLNQVTSRFHQFKDMLVDDENGDEHKRQGFKLFSKAKLLQLKGNIRSPREFFDRTRYGKPGPEESLWARGKRNISYFQVNYLLIYMIFFAYQGIVHPLFLISFLVLVLGWLYVYLGPALVVRGHNVTLQEKLGAMAVVTFLLVAFTSVWSTLFWVLGVSTAAIGVHAYFYLPADVVDFESDNFAGPPPSAPALSV